MPPAVPKNGEFIQPCFFSHTSVCKYQKQLNQLWLQESRLDLSDAAVPKIVEFNQPKMNPFLTATIFTPIRKKIQLQQLKIIN